MKAWLLAITCAATAAAVADALCPEGGAKRMVRLSGGLLLLLAVLNPIKGLMGMDLSDALTEYQAQYRVMSASLTDSNQDRAKAIIAGETSAYISDKAATLGIRNCRVAVSCQISDEGFPLPDAVTVSGAGEDEAWDALRRAITEDFSISAENQTFERTDVP